MRFGKIDNVILLGGSPVLAEFAIYLKTKKNDKYAVTCFSCERQLKEVINKDNETLQDVLEKNDISFYIAEEDICNDEKFKSLVTDTTLGLGFGEVWTFNKGTVDKFNGKLLDLMGIRLPQYRGGAHYSWQILTKNKIGCCNLQVINEEMVQGVFDSGKIVKTKEYFFPSTARVPQNYFDKAINEELSFLKEFLEEVEDDYEFELIKLDENFSTYFPRLYTLKQGFINWDWNTEDITTFICAFDVPYKGASTFINNKRVFLRNCHAEFNDGIFHPFQAGLVYRKNKRGLFVATTGGTLIIKEILDEHGADVRKDINIGDRFYTPQKNIEEAMMFKAVYTHEGIKEYAK